MFRFVVHVEYQSKEVKSMHGAVRYGYRYCAGAVEVRSWYTHGSLERCGGSIGDSVQCSMRFSPLAVGKHARMHSQYVDVKTSICQQHWP